jgi:diguanylate cyclase (GGDEF)-like protein
VELEDTGILRGLNTVEPCAVMVVEDDDLIRAQLVSLLKAFGYQVHSASCGVAALKTLALYPCQVVITDWEMPEMDGPALCRALRSQDYERYTYVMMLTVRNSSADVLCGLAAGADDYLVKGTPREELLARIEVGRRITTLETSLRASGAENRRLSVTDSLTGAHNRRYLMKYLPQEIERCRRYGRPIGILSCDIDRFKRINDAFGHEAGDEVLQAFVTRTRSCTRESVDWLARAGGEEFVLVLPETTLNGAASVAEKVRSAFAGEPIATREGELRATVSIGVTAMESPVELADTSVSDMLRAADRCLYQSKKLGGNCVTSMAPRSAMTGLATFDGADCGIH